MTQGSVIARIVVTGASGYLGRHIIAQCLERKLAVAVVARDDRTAGIPSRVEIITTSDPDWTDRLTDFAPDAILHTAAWSGMTHQPHDVDAIIDANIRLGTHLLDVAASLPHPPAFVWAGSFWQYAGGGREYLPNSLYAASKQAFAAIADYYRHQRTLPCLGLILHDIYGEADPRARLLSLIAASLAPDGDPIDLTDGTQPVSFVHVDDAAHAFLHAADLLHARTGGLAAIHAVAGEVAPLREQIDALLRTGDDGSRLRWGKRRHPEGAIMQLPDLPILPGWHPLVPLSEGFERLRHHA